MQIQIIAVETSNSIQITVLERMAGQPAVKYRVQPGQKLSLVIDGVPQKGGESEVTKKVKLRKKGDNLIIETWE